MTDSIEFIARGVLMGVGGSALIDVWAFALRRTLHAPTLDYAMLGRWIGHFPRGRFIHQRIRGSGSRRTATRLARPLFDRDRLAFVLLALWGSTGRILRPSVRLCWWAWARCSPRGS